MRKRALAAGLLFRGAGDNGALFLGCLLKPGLQELACKGIFLFFPASC